MRLPGALRACVLTFLMLFAVTSIAAAQTKGRVGLVMAYPASAGVEWPISDRWGIRVDGSFNHSSTTIEGRTSADTSAQTGAIGISALIGVKQSANFSISVAPRVGLAIVHSTSSQPFDSSQSTTRTPSVSGSFGARSALNEHFTVFGEVGLGYSRSSNVFPGLSTTKSTLWTVGSRSGVGVTVFF